jgi:hypothetical protein
LGGAKRTGEDITDLKNLRFVKEATERLPDGAAAYDVESFH